MQKIIVIFAVTFGYQNFDHYILCIQWLKYNLCVLHTFIFWMDNCNYFMVLFSFRSCNTLHSENPDHDRGSMEDWLWSSRCCLFWKQIKGHSRLDWGNGNLLFIDLSKNKVSMLTNKTKSVVCCLEIKIKMIMLFSGMYYNRTINKEQWIPKWIKLRISSHRFHWCF